MTDILDRHNIEKENDVGSNKLDTNINNENINNQEVMDIINEKKTLLDTKSVTVDEEMRKQLAINMSFINSITLTGTTIRNMIETFPSTQNNEDDVNLCTTKFKFWFIENRTKKENKQLKKIRNTHKLHEDTYVIKSM